MHCNVYPIRDLSTRWSWHVLPNTKVPTREFLSPLSICCDWRWGIYNAEANARAAEIIRDYRLFWLFWVPLWSWLGKDQPLSQPQYQTAYQFAPRKINRPASHIPCCTSACPTIRIIQFAPHIFMHLLTALSLSFSSTITLVFIGTLFKFFGLH